MAGSVKSGSSLIGVSGLDYSCAILVYITNILLNALFGDPAQAKPHALAAYRWAWADGEPYVHRYELTRTTELLQQMNVPIPNLPPKDEPFPWEADVRAAIEKLRAEKEK